MASDGFTTIKVIHVLYICQAGDISWVVLFAYDAAKFSHLFEDQHEIIFVPH